MAENYTESLIFTKNLDEKGTPFIPKLVEVAVISDNGKVQCKQNVYKKNGINIISPDGLRRVNKPEQLLSTTSAYFIYEDRGEVLFSDDLIGQTVAFEYYGTGNPNIGDCRVFTTLDNNGNIIETINDIIKEGRDVLESIRALGNGIIILNKLEEVIQNAETLNTALGIKITVGTEVSERLEADINTGNEVDSKLKATIKTGNSTNTTLTTTIGTANTTNTTLIQTDSTAKATDSALKQTIINGDNKNTQLNSTITKGEQVLGDLNTQITKIEETDNKVVQINPTDWVLSVESNRYEYIWNHGMGKTSLIFEYQTLKNGKKCSYFMDYEIQDENNIKFITESADTVFVNISAKYYNGLGFEESQIEVDKMVDGAKKVVMTRAERELLNSHSSQLEQKATKQEVEVERKRINNLTKLGEGSTTGDAELTDARVGFNGFIHSNLGNAIRGQVKQNLDGIKAIEYSMRFKRIEEFYRAEGYKISNGSAIADSNYCILQYKVENCDFLYLKALSNSEVKFQFQRSGSYSDIVGEPYKTQYQGFIRVPIGTTRLMINIEKGDTDSGVYTKGLDTILSLNDFCSTNEFLNSITWIDNKCLNTKGEVIENSNCSCMVDFIPITNPLKQITIKNLLDKNTWTVSGLCFYDNMNKFIGYYKAPKEGQFSIKINDIISNFPNAYYVRFTKLKDSKVYFIKDKTELKDNMYKLNMYENVLICGDSTTEGFVVDGDIYQVETKYSYPTQLKKMLPQWNITVKAKSGASAVSWRNMFYSSTDFSQYDLIIMELGYNGSDAGYFNMEDINTVGRNTYEYRKLIADIRSQNASAEIVLVLSSNYTSSWDKWDWKPILELVANESNCKIINLRDKTYLDLGADKYHGVHDGKMDYVHGNRRFYNAKAYVVAHATADVVD